MSLVPRVLAAMVAARGDAAVLHTGDIPYVVGTGTETEIDTDTLTLQGASDVLKQLLPEASQRAFDLNGSIRYECPPLDAYPGERFTVVALHEADELWIEIRCEPRGVIVPADGAVSTLFTAPAATALVNRHSSAGRMWSELDDFNLAGLDEGLPAAGSPVELAGSRRGISPAHQAPHQPLAPQLVDERPSATDEAWSDLSDFEVDKLDEPLPPLQRPSPTPHETPARDIHAVTPLEVTRSLMAGAHTRDDSREWRVDVMAGKLVRLLRLVAARGGSALYLAADAQPSMRIDGEMRVLDGEEILSAEDTETALLALMPKGAREALGSGERTEWVSEVTEIGRLRCVSFRDRHGAGGIFRILNAHPVGVDELGLCREVQALALEPEGLVLVAGPRSSGKSTLIAAFVHLINRTQHDHIITIEGEISTVHESHGSMISQREVRGGPQDVLAAARRALREDPDVLVIDEDPDNALTELTLEAAGSGRLVIASLPAHTSPDAVNRFIDRFALERRRRAQLAFAENLRGIIALSLPRKPGGGRVAAREVLLNTPAVASLLAEGRTGELHMTIEEGAKIGMMSLNESLAALVKSNTVDVLEAYRRAADRQGLLVLLKRHGVDTAPLERHV